MRLLHYSSKPVGEIHSVEQAEFQPFTHIKPKGFWVSVEGEDDWRSWCLSERFRLGDLTHVHEVSLDAAADILVIKGPHGIDSVTQTYGEPVHWGERSIRWGDIAARWQGIIIAPYVWSRRLGAGADWYYGWDCASGCIWDARAIASVTLLEVVPEPAPENVS